MAETRTHKATATRIANRFHGEFMEDGRVDVETPTAAIAVETPGTVRSALRGLQGHRKRVYIAGTNREAVHRALGVTAGTTVGVLDSRGRVVKSSSRRPG